MLLAIVFAYLGYKKASESGRNGILWAFIALAAFIGSQFLVGILLGIGMGIGVALLGWSEGVFESYDILVRIFAIVAGLLAGYLVLKYLDRIPDNGENYTAPPPPPDFKG